MYDDNYETCDKTFLTLRVYCENKNPDEISSLLEIKPSSIQTKGQETDLTKKRVIKINGWFLTTEDLINSKDCRRHIDYLTSKLIPIKAKLKKLKNDGAKIDITCFWTSKDGHGGPTLSQKQFLELAELEIDFWFDIY
jgi:hypothetical protein